MTVLDRVADLPLQERPLTPPPAPRARPDRSRLVELAGLALLAALVPLREAWVVQAVSLVLLFTVPGAILVRALRVPRAALAAFPVYVPAASLALLTFTGLGVDLVGQAAGLAAPLRTVPLLVGVEGVSLLLLLAAHGAAADVGVRWRLRAVRVTDLWPLLLPALAAAGALRLTNGHGATVATVALAACLAALAYGLVRGRSLSTLNLRLLVFGIALALLWSYALRGTFVFGYDISTEFHVLDGTLSTGVWHTAHRDDAYGAMLSLTVLPALLHGVAGASALLLLKAVYPALFALFAVGLVDLARRYVDARFAVAAVAMIIAQSYFFQQMPAIARQELALVLFIALVAAVLDARLVGRRGLALVGVLALGMVVSHYSTTYLAVGMFALAAICATVLRLARRPSDRMLAIGIAFVVGALGAAGWYGAVTHSTSNVTQVSDSLRDNGLQLLPNRAPGQSLLSVYLNGNTVSRVDAARYQQLIVRQYATQRSFVTPLRGSGRPQYALRDVTTTTSPEGRSGAALRLLATLASQLLNLLAVVAVLGLALSARTSRRMRTVAVLGLATLASLAFLRLSGTAASAYNQERAFVQSTVLLSIAVAAALQWLGGRRRILGVAVVGAAVVGFVAMMGGNAGLRAKVLGGAPSVNLANAGEDYERFYSRSSELSAARWAQGFIRPGQLRYADNYGQLRILAASGSAQGLLTGVTPRTLDRDAWVFGSTTNLVSGRARGSVGRNFAVYAWPSRFLDHNFNRVFSNGGAAIYHR